MATELMLLFARFFFSHSGSLPYRICPRPSCGVPQERIDGCNAISCPMCRVGFCWLCMATVPDGEDPHKHFGVPGTPCFSKIFAGVYSDE